MKKGTKGMLIAASAFAVAGIGLCIGGISVAAVETGGNVFDQAGQLIQDNNYPLAGLIHLGNRKYHSSDTDWDADCSRCFRSGRNWFVYRWNFCSSSGNRRECV